MTPSATLPRTLFIFVALCAFTCIDVAWSDVAHAQDFIGTRALSLSEAYRAIATGNDAIYMNPAGIGVITRYSPEVHYVFDIANEHHLVDASIVDSKTSPFAVGVAYTFQGSQFSRRATLEHTGTLALAYPFVPELFLVGVGLKYVNISDAFLGNYLNALSADLGVMSRLPFGLSLAAVGYNLIPIRSTEVPISAGFGAALDLGPLSALVFGGIPGGGKSQTAAGMPVDVPAGTAQGPLANLTLTVDWAIRFFTVSRRPEHRISTGIEYLAFESIPLRAGYLYDQANQDHLVSIGGGFIVPYFGLDVAWQQSVVNLNTRLFAISAKFFLPM